MHGFTQTYWQQKVDHTIDVTLHVADRSIDGFSKIVYQNNSPDTLTYIWFHIWPNAYQHKHTAFGKQLLENGDTRFQHASPALRGYINKLDFKIMDVPVKTEGHPEHTDIIKLHLPTPLYPGKSIRITTPFHVQLPFNFSRGGWNGYSFQLTQWYPKPAVYDAKGWHPIPYLDQGEFYADFGDYIVNITVPKAFAVAATGQPQQPVEQVFYAPSKNERMAFNWETMSSKTLSFKQQNIHDFAWFADPTLTLQKDTIKLPSGKIIQAYVYFHLNKIAIWQNSLANVKQAIHTLSEWIGDYPYDVVTVVDGQMGFQGGMEYPTITMLTDIKDPKELDLTIFHEIGHNWFYGALASNERRSPWMDEGMNTYYEKRYEALKYPYTPMKGLAGLLYDPRFNDLLLQQQIRSNKDQPISTSADRMTASNYNYIAYNKAALWMKKVESTLGTITFDKAMKHYYDHWKFKHPDRNDFKKTLENSSQKNLDTLFSLLDKKGPLEKEKTKPLAILPQFQVHKIYDKQPIFLNPAAIINGFNGFMGGLIIHNLTLPMPRFTMFLAPLYGFKSKQFNGWSRLGYSWYPKTTFQSIELSSVNNNLHSTVFSDTIGNEIGRSIVKIAPSIKFIFKETNPRSTIQKTLLFRYVHINERELELDASRNILNKASNNYAVLQTKFSIENARTINPWKADAFAETHKDFYRLSVQGKYFLNYIRTGGIHLRFFTGKFIYRGNPSAADRLQLERFHLQMTGPNGNEDYSYSTPYLSRFAMEGFASQQIMERDGYFKLRTGLLQNNIGRADNWLSALNIEMDLPRSINPIANIPLINLKLFFDLGTNGTLWKNNDPRFLYNGGIQISFVKNVINFYFPLIYSSVYRDYLANAPKTGFFQRMSFSVNLSEFNPFKLKLKS